MIFNGTAEPNTNSPGAIDGYTTDRLIRACCDGEIDPLKDIGDTVEQGEVIVRIEDQEVKALISGTLRGMIQRGVTVTKGMKIGDIDPRKQPEFCNIISDKARAIGGGVLEAYLSLSKSS